MYKFSLLRRACKGRFALLFYEINLVFSILILGQSPLLLFVSLSYKFYWFGPKFNCVTHCSKWGQVVSFFGPYTHTHTHTHIYIYIYLQAYIYIFWQVKVDLWPPWVTNNVAPVEYNNKKEYKDVKFKYK